MDYYVKSFLEKLGLSGNEIKLYLAALELGESTAAQLAKRARIHRVAAYALIDELVSKGMFTQTSVKRGKRISAKHPKHIESLLRNERRALRRLSERYEQILPELTSLYTKASVHPRVQFFEGIKGLEQINADIIATLKELPPDERMTYSYSNPNIIAKNFPDYIKDEGGYVNQRKEHGIHNKAIALDGPVTQEIKYRDEEELREMIILPESLFPFRNDITIYADKMAIEALQKDFIGVIIQSSEIVQDQRAIFDLAWEGAKAIQNNT